MNILLCTDFVRFWWVNPLTDDVELLDNAESFSVVNKMNQGLIRETGETISPRGFDKTLNVLQESA